jgi:hypothetical protein
MLYWSIFMIVTCYAHLISMLKRVPLLNCQWTVCPSPVTKMLEFRPDIIGILLGRIGFFLGLFWRAQLSIGCQNFPAPNIGPKLDFPSVSPLRKFMFA